MVVDKRRKQVVGCGYGVKIAINAGLCLPWNYLRVSASRKRLLLCRTRGPKSCLNARQLLPKRDMASASPMLTVVLPSPYLVGFMAVTRISLALGLSLLILFIFALYFRNTRSRLRLNQAWRRFLNRFETRCARDFHIGQHLLFFSFWPWFLLSRKR